ncbi:hypothetical protein VTL71DRAFT_7844 [Oculimacula yallundae]|uniref:Peptidase A1 domain-containing protein n=1 Tax=Oculimacula yallundae TaxID=86028 RepID=A0ABR4CVU8_9HELO
MRSSSLPTIVLGLLCSPAYAKIFCFPLWKEQISHYATAHPSNILPDIDQNQNQKPMILSHNNDVRQVVHDTGVPISDVFDYWAMYVVNITLGTPPQTFRAVVDLNWADTFVSSTTRCGGERCKAFSQRYNSSASSSYTENGTFVPMSYFTINGLGYVSSDDFMLGTTKVPNLDFIELCACPLGNHVTPDLELFDGVLGLAMGTERPPGYRDQQPSRIASPFRQMTEQGVLDKNLFSVLWPTGSESTGDLMFGGYNESLFEGGLVGHQLFPEGTTEWKIQVTTVYLLIDFERDEFHETAIKEIAVKPQPGQDMTALLSTRTPFISLPSAVTNIIKSLIDLEVNTCRPVVSMDCDRRHELPDVVIEFGNQNVTMHGEDYITKYFLTPEERNQKGCEDVVAICVAAIFESPTWGDDENLMTLGMGFLRKVYTVFDWDEKSISFGKLRDG